MRRSVRAFVRQRIRLQFQAPFWSRIPSLALWRYPRRLSDRLFFWLSAAVYSLIYFFCIALVVVIFTHSLYGWSGFESYVAATHDVMYKNFGLVGAFVGIESWLIYRQAMHRQLKGKEKPGKASIYGVVLYPAAYVAVLYAALKILTGNFMLEPNVAMVLAGFYAFFVVMQYIVHRLKSLEIR